MKPCVKKTLPLVVADYLQAEIAAGRTGGLLPGERHLCAELNVSRGTLRTALGILRRRNVVNSRHGSGTRTLKSRVGVRRIIPRSIGILSPVALETHRLFYALELEKIRELLQPLGVELTKHYGRNYFTRNPQWALRRLTEKSPHRCWILFLSTPGTQRWFFNSGLPCLVAGSCLADVALPFVDIDHRAVGRHAAGLIIRHGHRVIALLCRRQESPGLIMGREAFVEQCTALGHTGARVVVERHDDSVSGISRAVQRVLSTAPKPTILVTETPNQYLIVQTTLQTMGLTIPDDVSLISRSDEPFMDFMLPPPVRYQVDPQALAKKIVQAVDYFVNDQVPPPHGLLIVPKVVRGQSLAAPKMKLPAG